MMESRTLERSLIDHPEARHTPIPSSDAGPDLLDRFDVTLNIDVRRCRWEDLPALEWFGLFTEHREIIERTFEDQQAGNQLMLLAVAGNAPVGQLWIDLAGRKEDRAGWIWAVRTFPWLQGVGIGGRLLRAAEEELRLRGYTRAELAVEQDNEGAQRFYARSGYEYHGTSTESYSYTTPDGVFMEIPQELFVLRKQLK